MLCGDRCGWRVAGGVASFSFDDGHPGFGEDFGAHVATLFGPLVGLLGEDGADESDDRGTVGEDPDHVGAAASAAKLDGRRGLAMIPHRPYLDPRAKRSTAHRGYRVGVQAGGLVGDEVRTAEVIAALSLATDLGIGMPLEHGLVSTLLAMRLAESLAVDRETARQAYYFCLLFYVGCTAGAQLAADAFGSDDALTKFGTPVRFGSRVESVRGLARAVAPPGGSPLMRLSQLARGVPRLIRDFDSHVAGSCEVAITLSRRLGLPSSVGELFRYTDERWDGKGVPGRFAGDEIPLAARIVHVARDTAFQHVLGGADYARSVVAERAGAAFDPRVARLLADDVEDLSAVESTWDETLNREPMPQLTLSAADIDRALAATGDFADLSSSYLVGHSAGVSTLAGLAARQWSFPDTDVRLVRRAALVHDLGRVAVPVRVWNQPSTLKLNDWEQVRLHAYHTERVLCRSPMLASLASVARFHHERLDGSGYHGRVCAPALSRQARVLAAADAYHAMTEPRAHRPPLLPGQATDTLASEARAGRLDADAVAAVLGAAGQAVPRIERPAGLTDREAQVIGLLARGLQTKQMASALGVSTKTADRHIQNAYAKIGVSTRAGATLFAIEHGLLFWGELPISRPTRRS
jgi:HD-GYP domain-containing protein (c-di-GMP phosphodiesterase class II)